MRDGAESDFMQFSRREEFRDWLFKHCQSSAGIWLVFGKTGGPNTIKPGEALEEALCFGWIDGKLKSIFLCAERGANFRQIPFTSSQRYGKLIGEI